MIGDFARWNDKIVFGCDDSAKSESTVVVRKEATKKEEVVVQQVGDAGKPDQG